MHPKARIMSFTIGAVLLGLMLQTAAPGPAVAGGPVGPPTVKADQMTRRQFREQMKMLPDTAVIEFKGRRTTAGEIRAKMRLPANVAEVRTKAVAAQLQANASQAQARFAAARAKFLQQQQAKLQADNAKAMAEFTRLRQGGAARAAQLDAIEQEAGQLFHRSKTASPAERGQIEQRAGQLLQQLQQVGR
jgi:hypothetical protein